MICTDYFLSNLYIKNKLLSKNNLKLLSEKIDFQKIKQPAFILGTENDHISPIKLCFKATKHFEKPTFVETESGHLAGIIHSQIQQNITIEYQK